jgi:conjugal transfer mating pair stabilization protein TraG
LLTCHAGYLIIFIASLQAFLHLHSRWVYLPQSYQHLTRLSGDASSIIRQNMMANAIRDGVFAMGARLNVKAAIDSFAASRTQDKIPATLTNIGLMSAYWLPIIQCALFCLIIGCFVFVLFFLPFPSGLKFLQFYCTLYLWLALWAPISTVINYIMTVAVQYSLSFAAQGITTLEYQSGINQMYENLAAIGGYLALSAVSLSYMLISKRIDGVLGAVHHMNGAMSTAATSAAEEVQTGNYNYGNTSFANHHSFNTQSLHQDQNARISMGGVETSLDGGSMAHLARNGSESINMGSAMSHTPLNIQLGESTRAAFSELSDKSLQSSLVQANASSEQYGTSLKSLMELGQTQMHAEQSGEGASISNSAGFNTAASKVSNLVDQFAQDHNISHDKAVRVLTAVSASGGVSAKLGGLLGPVFGGVEVGAHGRVERDSSHSKQDAHLANEARRFSEEHHFNDVVNQARQATQDSHFRTSDDHSARLADNFSAGYDKSVHYREEAVANYTASEGYHRQATLAQEQTASINLDAQTGFIDWLSQHRAPNSQGTIGLQQAEWMIRHDPEMAQAYARQFIAEKTSQSINQFQQHHSLNSAAIQNTAHQHQQQINNKGVDSHLAEYTKVVNQQTKKMNVGQVNHSSEAAVEKERNQVNKELRERTQIIVDGGSVVMQGVITTEANQ